MSVQPIPEFQKMIIPVKREMKWEKENGRNRAMTGLG
jgi:hypothetical protein